MTDLTNTIQNLLEFTEGKKYNTIYADPPWQFQNRTGKVAPEHKRLNRYETMSVEDIKMLPVSSLAGEKAHLYLWVPNALLPDGLAVMDAWGFEYKGNIVWEKIRKDGGPDGRGVGFYFRNVTELLLFGIKKKSAPNRTLQPARSQRMSEPLTVKPRCASTAASPMKSFRSLKPAARVPALNFLPAV